MWSCWCLDQGNIWNNEALNCEVKYFETVPYNWLHQIVSWNGNVATKYNLISCKPETSTNKVNQNDFLRKVSQNNNGTFEGIQSVAPTNWRGSQTATLRHLNWLARCFLSFFVPVFLSFFLPFFFSFFLSFFLSFFPSFNLCRRGRYSTAQLCFV